ncbi:hypothetical protein KW795_00920 [Candidatus Microgenomates bacterium]|nr:hypothetical protein [Candidatus Microgenomates bacterium]
MLKQIGLVLALVSILTMFSFSPVLAKKVLPRAQKTTTTNVVKSSGIITSVKFANYKRSILVTFSNLEVASKVTYSLTYIANGVEQGFGGSITDLSGTQTRDIVLGTCSHGVCRYDTGIKNAKFIVTTTLKNGKKVIKTFKLKV